MTKLMISVRNLREADQAYRRGADLLDIKEPRAGSLGRARWETIRAIGSRFSGRIELSAALGELVSIRGGIEVSALAGVCHVKLGLAGCASIPRWTARWRQALADLPATCRPVAVAYGDYKRAAAVEPLAVVDAAAAVGCRYVLLDTCYKDRGGLLDCLSLAAVGCGIEHARQRGLYAAVAGSLDTQAIEKLLPLAPDIIAVRGCVCRAGRSGALDPDQVTRLVGWFRQRTIVAPPAHGRTDTATFLDHRP